MSNRINFLPPWVETNLQPAFYDVESGTVLQQTARMYAKVNQLVRNFNDLSEEVQYYINQFVELRTYVENYFDNLDVQEEINHKLDEMAEDGTLAEIVAEYLQAQVTWTFDNVAGMKASTNLTDGSYAKTLGYYSVNDGGASQYKIITKTTEVPNDMDIIAVSDTLIAVLVPLNDTINIEQFGAKGDGVTDDSTAIKRALSFRENENITVNFTSGKTYVLGNAIDVYSNTTIELNGATLKDVDNPVGLHNGKNDMQFMNNLDSVALSGYGALQNFTIRNGTIDGNVGGVMFCMLHWDNALFENIKFVNGFHNGHIFDMGGCSNVTIRNCQFIGNTLTVAENAYREVIQPDHAGYENLPYWGDDPSFGFDMLPCKYITVEKCVFKKNDGDTYYLNAVGTHSATSDTDPHEYIIVKDCIFYSCEKSCVRLPYVNNAVIENNTAYIVNGSEDGVFNFNSVAYDGYTTNVIVRNNKCYLQAEVDVPFFMSYRGSESTRHGKNITVENNYYEGWADVSNSKYGADFIKVQNIEGLNIVNNTCYGANDFVFKGVNQSLANVVIDGNKIYNSVRFTNSTSGDSASIVDGLFCQNNNIHYDTKFYNTSNFVNKFGFNSDYTCESTSSSTYTRIAINKSDMFAIDNSNSNMDIPSWVEKNFKVSGKMTIKGSGANTCIFKLSLYDKVSNTTVVENSIQVPITTTYATADIPNLYFSSKDIQTYQQANPNAGRYALHLDVTGTNNITFRADRTEFYVTSC